MEGILGKNHHAESAISRPWQVSNQCALPPGGLRSPLAQQAISRWGGPSHRSVSAPLSSQSITHTPGTGPGSPQPQLSVRTTRAHFVTHGFMQYQHHRHHYYQQLPGAEPILRPETEQADLRSLVSSSTPQIQAQNDGLGTGPDANSTRMTRGPGCQIMGCD